MEACDRLAFPADAAPTRRTKKLRIQMRDSQVSTVLVPSESLLDDMEQLLRSPVEEFDLAAKDLGGNSELGAAPQSPHEQSDGDTESVEWPLQGDSENTMSLPEVVADVLPPLLPQFRAAFASMGCECHLPSMCSSDEECPTFLPRPFQERAASCHGGGFQFRSNETGEHGKRLCCCLRKIRGFPTWRVAQFVGSQRAVRCQGCPSAVSSWGTTSG